MATVNVQLPGGDIKQYTATTVGQLASQLGKVNEQASVNGEPVDQSYELFDYEFVTFTAKIKGA